MKKAIIISDSFKGTLSSKEIIDIFSESFNKYFDKDALKKIVISDGGEGMVDAFSSILSGKYINIKTSSPYLTDIDAKYFYTDDNVAIIESAEAIGLKLVEGNMNPAKTTTIGVGKMIKDAVLRGAKKIILGLGGSSTNDGGCGAALALYTDFLNEKGKLFIPTGENLNEIKFIDNTKTKELLKDVEIIVLSDVNNPMYGENGAAHVFARQKGADDEMISMLDDNLKYLSGQIIDHLGVDVSNIRGAGAAGAFGAGCVAFFDAKIKSGIDVILDLVDFDRLLDGCDMIFTGEGKFDSQSINGKVIDGIMKRSKVKNIPVIVVSGSVSEEVEHLVDEEKDLCMFSTNRIAKDYSVVKFHQRENYKYTIDNLLKLIKISENIQK